jgi:hypothetical protein
VLRADAAVGELGPTAQLAGLIPNIGATIGPMMAIAKYRTSTISVNIATLSRLRRAHTI